MATRIYHAGDVSFAPQALKDLAQLEAERIRRLPRVHCQDAVFHERRRLPPGRAGGLHPHHPLGTAQRRRGIRVAFAGSIIAMPGLPKVPAALGIDVDEQGEITGLF